MGCWGMLGWVVGWRIVFFLGWVVEEWVVEEWVVVGWDVWDGLL